MFLHSLNMAGQSLPLQVNLLLTTQCILLVRRQSITLPNVTFTFAAILIPNKLGG